MNIRYTHPDGIKAPSYIEVRMGANDGFLPYDDEHIMLPFGPGTRIKSGVVVVLMWENGREIRGYYAGSCIFPKKGRLHYLRLMSEDEYRQWESELIAYNRKVLYGDKDAEWLAKTRYEIRKRLSDPKYDLKDFMDGFD